MVERVARVDEGDAPGGDVAIEELHLAAPIREDEVVGERLVVIEEVLLDVLGLVAQAEDEVVVPPRRIPLHDVPEDRPVADRDHRLGNPLGLLSHSDAESAAEDDDLHEAALLEALWTVADGTGTISWPPHSAM